MRIKATLDWPDGLAPEVTYHDSSDSGWLCEVAGRIGNGYRTVTVTTGEGVSVTYEAADPDDVVSNDDVITGLQEVIDALA